MLAPLTWRAATLEARSNQFGHAQAGPKGLLAKLLVQVIWKEDSGAPHIYILTYICLAPHESLFVPLGRGLEVAGFEQVMFQRFVARSGHCRRGPQETPPAEFNV